MLRLMSQGEEHEEDEEETGGLLDELLGGQLFSSPAGCDTERRELLCHVLHYHAQTL